MTVFGSHSNNSCRCAAPTSISRLRRGLFLVVPCMCFRMEKATRFEALRQRDRPNRKAVSLVGFMAGFNLQDALQRENSSHIHEPSPASLSENACSVGMRVVSSKRRGYAGRVPSRDQCRG